MNEQYTFVATCLFGLEKFVGEEIEALGYKRVSTIDGRVTFVGDISAVARCNMWLRCAERLYLSMGTFPAFTFTELFDGTKKLPWEQWIGPDDAFPVKGHAIKSHLYSIPDCQSIVKKAIVERLSEEYGIAWFQEDCVKHQIEFFILDNEATLMIDLSGTPLHKRGYRPAAGVAPLRETLAAAMVKLARPREDVLFWDPFCGSGTIPLEAALMMTNTAPGINRTFAAEEFFDIPEHIWRDAREEAHDLQNLDTAFEAYASDIDRDMVRMAQDNVVRAGMQKFVKTFQHDALHIRADGRRGTIVCNPPYGERMMTAEEVAALYRGMGKHFASLAPWQVYIISSDEQFELHYGRRADKVRKLYNGMIRCGFYQYFKNEKKSFEKSPRGDKPFQRKPYEEKHLGKMPHGEKKPVKANEET